MPITNSGRLLWSSYAIFAVTITATYNANLISYLGYPIPTKAFHTVDDFINYGHDYTMLYQNGTWFGDALEAVKK